MSQPVLDQTTWGWTCDRDPTSTEPNDTGILQYGNLWRNSTNNNLWFCLDSGDYNNNDLVWGFLDKIVPNVPDISYSVRSSPSFGTSYSPSATNNVFVLATVNIQTTILQTGTINVQVDSGSGFSTISTIEKNSVLSNDTHTLSFIVPAGSTYQIIKSGTGTNTLNGIVELIL